jgi:hypothetical protein
VTRPKRMRFARACSACLVKRQVGGPCFRRQAKHLPALRVLTLLLTPCSHILAHLPRLMRGVIPSGSAFRPVLSLHSEPASLREHHPAPSGIRRMHGKPSCAAYQNRYAPVREIPPPPHAQARKGSLRTHPDTWRQIIEKPARGFSPLQTSDNRSRHGLIIAPP